MTAQSPDTLVNQHPRVKLEGLHLYSVIRGDPRTSRYGWGDSVAFSTQPNRPADAPTCSAMWRGYVATFVLQFDGRLRLAAFEFLLSIGNWQKQDVNELLSGDFWMVMKPTFFGQRTYVPFCDGIIVEDRDQWIIEKPRVAPAD